MGRRATTSRIDVHGRGVENAGRFKGSVLKVIHCLAWPAAHHVMAQGLGVVTPVAEAVIFITCDPVTMRSAEISSSRTGVSVRETERWGGRKGTVLR